MEFKVQNITKEKSLEQTVENALRQIEEKEYDTELLARGIKKERIRIMEFAFRGEKKVSNRNRRIKKLRKKQ